MTLIRTADRFYPSLLNQLFNRELLDWNNTGFSAEDSTLPAVNILEDENRIQIEVAAPGMKKDDFKVELNQNRLTVSAESEKESNETNERYSRKEFNYRSFTRQFNVPVETINGDQIQASYKDGILMLTLPKREELKPKPARAIEIQ
ncbi:MAG: Hsp20/alpha crystallin family protein [Bacteroidetes bacterium]|nr:Hsp20/alpha crystallin family protein [Bacteroidota bacterium]MCL6102569.1 Hsp20/alpha crystallin family protein [Bacteroidota bacterium]